MRNLISFLSVASNRTVRGKMARALRCSPELYVEYYDLLRQKEEETGKWFRWVGRECNEEHLMFLGHPLIEDKRLKGNAVVVDYSRWWE